MQIKPGNFTDKAAVFLALLDNGDISSSRCLDATTKWSYMITMEFEWDEDKRQRNLEKHGVDFVDAVLILADVPLILEDMRRDYGEQRCLALGESRGLLFAVAFTIRDGAFRIISARRANARERRIYDRRIAQDAADPHDTA